MDVLKEVDIFWDFKEQCLANRVALNNKLLKLLKSKLESLIYVIPKGKFAYRARLYKANEKQELDDLWFEIIKIATTVDGGKPDYEKITEIAHEHLNKEQQKKRFKGYNAKESFVNLNVEGIPDGRCNYRFVPCLYMAESIDTAISEMKPTIKSNISVAKVKVVDELRLIDLRIQPNSALIELIGFLFTESVTLEKPDAYIYTQIICDFIKSQGYDGVVYSSCQDIKGTNYAIFNYEKCKAISSEVYTVNSVVVNYSKRQI